MNNKENILGYIVERKRVKNLNLRINSDLQVYISAPMNMPTYQIEQFIKSKEEYIRKSKEKLQKYKENMVDETLEDGSNVKFLGKVYKIMVEESNVDRVVVENDKFILYTTNNEFEHNKKTIDNFYYTNAKKIFSERMVYISKIMQETYSRLIINKIKGKWGYCQHNTRVIALNTNLIKRSPFEIDYVIVHELAHLQHPNHSKNFYRHVEKYMPNYKKAEELLKYR